MLQYERVANALDERIRAFAYAPGTRIPGTRQLAREFQVSINTVLQAQRLLEFGGLIEAVARSGYYVRWVPPSSASPAPRQFKPKPQLVRNQGLILDLLGHTARSDLAQLGAALPDVAYMPARALHRCATRAARTRSDECLRYESIGLTSLRQRLAQRMQAQGSAVHADELVLTQGCHEAVLLALRALTSPGDIVALESPTYYGLLQVVESLGLKALELPSDAERGLDPQALREAGASWDIKACVVVSNFSNPLGSCPNLAAKRSLLAVAEELDIPLIEDDLYGDLAFDGIRPATYKSLDHEGRVLYCNSFSKTVAPGLRLGWIAPGPYLDKVRHLKFTQNLACPSLDQHVLDQYLRDGGLDRHLRRVRAIYAANVARAAALIERVFPAGTSVTHPRGGFVLWIRLPQRQGGMKLYESALRHGISIAPGPIFSTTSRYDGCFRINCARSWEAVLEPALRQLGKLVPAIAG